MRTMGFLLVLPAAEQIGGIDIPSEGTFKVLFVFCQFSDDNYDTGNSYWTKGSAPSFMNTWVDATWNQNATAYSLTDYFNQMSMNKFKLIGNSVSVIAPHTRQWYLDNNKDRSFIHSEIIQQLDQTIDFSAYDNWTKSSNYNHLNVADGKVDFVVFIWRNTALDRTDAGTVISKLYMGWYGDTSIYPEVSVDGGLRTVGWEGATIRDVFYKDVKQFTIHEIAHYLLGGNDTHNGFGAMLSGYGIGSKRIKACIGVFCQVTRTRRMLCQKFWLVYIDRNFVCQFFGV